MILQDQMVLWPFMFFFIQSIIFFDKIPTTQQAIANLSAPPPQRTAGWSWGVGLFEYIGYAMDFIGWFAILITAALAIIFSVFIIPFSVMAWYPGLMFIEIPALLMFVVGILYKIPPIVDIIIKLLTSIAQGIAGLLGAIGSIFGLGA